MPRKSFEAPSPKDSKQQGDQSDSKHEFKPFEHSPHGHSAQEQLAILDAKLKKETGESLTPEEQAMSAARSDRLSHTPPQKNNQQASTMLGS
jgi:hypothetical protein